MGREVYSALSGAQTAWRQLETVSNNLANVSTSGYRAQRVSFATTGTGGLGNAYAIVSGVGVDETDGALINDASPSHLALRGPGMFVLGDGSYTRDGSFRVDGEGQIVTQDGTPVLGDAGPIQVDPKETFTVGLDGTVTGSSSGAVGKLKLVQLSQPQPLGGNRWSGTAAATEGTTVIQGALEGSNVDPMRGMAEMMEATRFFEAQQKVMQTSDEMQQRLNRTGGS